MLTAEESEAVKENLLIGLQLFEQHLDAAITHSNRARQEAVIWQTIDDNDNAFLVDLMVQAGLRIPAAGQAVRYLANITWQYRLGTILLPRFLETWRFYGANKIGFW